VIEVVEAAEGCRQCIGLWPCGERIGTNAKRGAGK
jgi:hypothetical protein